jgi:hypothetical protein
MLKICDCSKPLRNPPNAASKLHSTPPKAPWIFALLLFAIGSAAAETVTLFGTRTGEANTPAGAEGKNFSETKEPQTVINSVFVGLRWEGITTFFFARDGTAWEWDNGSGAAWFGEWRKIDEETIHCSIGGENIFKISPDKNQIQRYYNDGNPSQSPRTRRELSPSPDIRDVQWDFNSGWKLVFESSGRLFQQDFSEGRTYYYHGRWVDLGGGYFGKKNI